MLIKGNKFFKDIIIILFVILSIIFLIEVVLELFFSQNIITDYINNIPLGKRDKILGHLNNPLSKASVKGPEFSCNYEINNQGFRDLSDYSAPKPSPTTRILLVGDSFTFGSGTNYDKIWPVIFENEMRKNGNSVEVIKAGVPGYSTRTEVLYLEDIFERYHPDIVVLTFIPHNLFSNNPIDSKDTNISISKITGHKQVEDDSIVTEHEKKKPFNIPRLLQRILLSNDIVYTKIFANTFRGDFFKDSAVFRKQMDITKNLLDQGITFTTKHGASFVLHSVPQLFQVIVKAKDLKIDGINVDLIDRELLSYSRQKSIIFIKALDKLSFEYNINNKLYYRFDGHLNDEGNKIVAINFYENFIKVYGSKISKKNNNNSQ